MQRLQRVLASSVLRALRARDHVVISSASTDAITDEMEAVIAPALDHIAPHLNEVSEAMSNIDTGRFVRADLVGDGRGGDGLGGDELVRDESIRAELAAGRGEILSAMVDRITERLLESDHVDDIHADDHVLRRDAFRAIRKILLGYIRGDLEVEDVPEEETGFTVVLERLGYVVSSVAHRLEPAMLQEALERAAAAGEGELLWLDVKRHVAAFDLPGGPEVSRLTLEEAITEELVGLVDTELVELPCIEQVLELDHVACSSPGFTAAVERAEARLRAETGSMASCCRVDDHTVIATFTPLSEDAAANADDHFAAFLAALEHELAELSGHGGHAPEEQPPASSKKVPRDGSRGKRQAPKSRPRGKRAPKGRSSQTRARARAARNPKKTKRRNG